MKPSQSKKERGTLYVFNGDAKAVFEKKGTKLKNKDKMDEDRHKEREREGRDVSSSTHTMSLEAQPCVKGSHELQLLSLSFLVLLL